MNKIDNFNKSIKKSSVLSEIGLTPLPPIHKPDDLIFKPSLLQQTEKIFQNSATSYFKRGKNSSNFNFSNH